MELGFVNKIFDEDLEKKLKEEIALNKPVVFLLGLDEINPRSLEGSFVVYCGHHGDVNAQHANIILPTPAYTEKSSTFMNIEGRAIQTSRCHNPLGDAKEEWKIFRVLSVKTTTFFSDCEIDKISESKTISDIKSPNLSRIFKLLFLEIITSPDSLTLKLLLSSTSLDSHLIFPQLL